MQISTAIAIYFLVWWITLFAVLPWGVKAQDGEEQPGTDPGAPRAARIWTRLIWTTVVSSVVFGLGAFAYIKGLVTLDDLARWMGVPQFKD